MAQVKNGSPADRLKYWIIMGLHDRSDAKYTQRVAVDRRPCIGAVGCCFSEGDPFCSGCHLWGQLRDACGVWTGVGENQNRKNFFPMIATHDREYGYILWNKTIAQDSPALDQLHFSISGESTTTIPGPCTGENRRCWIGGRRQRRERGVGFVYKPEVIIGSHSSSELSIHPGQATSHHHPATTMNSRRSLRRWGGGGQDRKNSEDRKQRKNTPKIASRFRGDGHARRPSAKVVNQAIWLMY